MFNTDPLLAHLNPQQSEAVTLPSRPALVLAGAGSGKTRVLTTRIAWLLKQGMASPAGILAVTFTNKAAREMLSRLEAMLPMSTHGMWIGTFHGLCNRLLRTHHRDAGLDRLFQILDSGDQLSAIKRLLKTLNVDDEKFPPRELQYFINANKEAGLRPHAVEALDRFTQRRVELYQEYENQCQRESVVDFAELLLRSFELLQRNEPIRHHYQQRFRYILVDEFQDTNILQYRWLKLLASHGEEGGAALFCVGDDDQSIYRFRGAEVGNMRDFEREFHVQDIIRLEQNYRSHGNILDAANAIIRHNSNRLGKNLWTNQGEGEPIRVFEAYSDSDEARWIVEETQSLQEDGIPRNNIAVLYRANAQSRVLEHQFFSAGIPYRVHGGLRFFERQEIKHALAYLRLIVHAGDDTAFMRVVNFPARGIGARTQEILNDTARQRNDTLYASVAHFAGKSAAPLARFVSLIDTLRQETRPLPLPELVEHVIDHSGLRAHYQTEREGQDRLENLSELVRAAENFRAEFPASPETLAQPHALLADFLDHASLEAGEHQASAQEEAVQLMTVHAAKGLEFQIVFLCGLEEELFPHSNSLTESGGLEEERRLMYVAVTRTRERLYLSCAQSRLLHGQTHYHLRSRFLEEIPKELLKPLTQTKPLMQNAYSGGYGSTARPQKNFSNQTASPPPLPASRGLPNGLHIGQNVRHPAFGYGVIVDAAGGGKDAKLCVNFGDGGIKWLLMSVAKLEAA
ncbi:MAG: UvrD-helicase domain-containing protein [Azoarcus sp.]|jgi:DNA helicase-2/ATP-dependent DNA helicase PcrA|nr:UvrD-helicase domain-containing protein [Azoarcus sp.]